MVWSDAQPDVVSSDCCSSGGIQYEGVATEGMEWSESSSAPVTLSNSEQFMPVPLGSDGAIIATPMVDSDSTQLAAETKRADDAETALKRSQANVKKTKTALQAAQEESAKAMAAAKAASQEQLGKLRTQNGNLKKNLDAARQRIERMQVSSSDQQAKPTAKAANDSQNKDKKPANKKPTAKNAADKKPAAKKAKQATPAKSPAAKPGKKADGGDKATEA